MLSFFTMTSTDARDIEMERLERRAYESALWGQALVAGNEMIEGARRSGQKLNQVRTEGHDTMRKPMKFFVQETLLCYKPIKCFIHIMTQKVWEF